MTLTFIIGLQWNEIKNNAQLSFMNKEASSGDQQVKNHILSDLWP